MQDRPTLEELLKAVMGFLEKEVLPAVEGDPRLRFRTLVALNALGIALREVGLEAGLRTQDRAELARLLGREGEPAELLAELARRIRAGEVPQGTLPALKALVRRKLLVASPRYLERYR